ncbi:hypothetical protein MHBO_001338 [Bonamia ostreae]|uniref:Uncharacterized protein n=1 Tax=Bonamia ostreae TaxID=126728 RepID=A0ABV2AJU8_9EUKA
MFCKTAITRFIAVTEVLLSDHKDYKRPGEPCSRDSDCGSWICTGICQLAFGMSEGFKGSKTSVEAILSIAKSALIFFLATVLVLLSTKACCPARGLCCCSCRCKRI